MARACRDDLPDKQSEEFFVMGLDTFLVICPTGRFGVTEVHYPMNSARCF
jgi:hypothetical protein